MRGSRVLLWLACSAPVPLLTASWMTPRDLPPLAVGNSNEISAGTRRGSVLTVSLVAQQVRLRMLADDGPAVDAQTFVEEGKAPTVPGPLMRVPLGTRIQGRVRNTLHDTLIVTWRCASPCKHGQRTRIAPGATETFTILADAPGTFVYRGYTLHRGDTLSGGFGGQLGGVIVVDAGTPIHDRILVITDWIVPRDTTDPTKGERAVFALNGKLWPNTERLTYTVGDSVHWRVVHLGEIEHPMHLHGFYFRVESRGDGGVDRTIPRADQPLEVTEELGALASATIAWSPDREGNWLFHCHKSAHTTPKRNIDAGAPQPTGDHAGADHALNEMAGLVMGITVRPAAGPALAALSRVVDRRLRLLVHRHDHFYGAESALGYALQTGDSIPARDSVVVPGPTVVLTRGQLSQITVVNEAEVPTAVHWHGIELESYFDGVAGWSGAASRLAPIIAPADSFVARFVPPRAGTFIYHTHMDDMRQLAGGLYGPLVILEPGQRWNDTTDHVFVIGQAGLRSPAWIVVNGLPAPNAMQLKGGVAHRLRFLSMTLDDEAAVFIERDKGAVMWRPLAKDGTPVPRVGGTSRPARLHIGPGETYDFEVTLAPGDYRMRVMSYTNVLQLITVR